MSSWWLAEEAPPLACVRIASADVEIVGAGVIGIYAALTLAGAGARVRVHDAREVAGGASGRNGGWCSALLPMGLDAIAKQSSRAQAVRLQTVMHDV